MEGNCQLCLQPLTHVSSVESNNNAVVVNQLWSYLYHQNVQEAVAPNGNLTNKCSQKFPSPKLTFSLSVCDNPSCGNEITENLKICSSCSKELNRLDKLHQELEKLKGLINSQVKRLDHVWRSADEDGKISTILSSAHASWKLPTIQTSFAGTTMGRENISKVLKFLDAFCDEIVPSYAASSLTSVPPASTVAAISEVNNRTMEECQIPEAIFSEQEEESDNSAINTFNSDSLSSSNFEEVQTMEIDKVETEEMKLYMQSSDETANYTTPQVAVIPIKASSSSSKSFFQQTFASTSADTPATSSISGSSEPKTKNSVKKQCPICGKWVASYYLSAHCKTHSGIKPHWCQICNKGFTQRSSYNLHRRQVHQGADETSSSSQPTSLLKCSLCLMEFSRKSSLKMHLQRRHKLSDQAIDQLPMDEGSSMLDPDTDEEHQSYFASDNEQHHFLVPLQASVSGSQSTSLPSSLANSVNSRGDKKQCPTCSKWVSSNYFSMHQKVHVMHMTGEKPYVCELCNSRFTQKSALNLHRRVQHKISTGSSGRGRYSSKR